MNFRARGFEREIWGGNRGFVSTGLNSFDLRRELLTSNVREESFWRWINDEVEHTSLDIKAVLVKTIHVRMVKSWGEKIRRMPRYSFKLQFQDTFARMICLNSLFFLGERQPTVMKYVWEKSTNIIPKSSHRPKCHVMS